MKEARKVQRVLEGDPMLLRQAEALPEDGARPQAVDGAALVRDIESFYTRFLVLPARTALPLALWTLATFAFDLFDALAYLAVTSPTPRCGKTRLLEVASLVVANPFRTSNISEAALFRVIAKFRPTLLLDEQETLQAKGERAEYLRNLINAGNRRDATVVRCVGKDFEVQHFDVYGPKILAAVGSLPQTVRDRAIVVEMQRRKDSEPVERFLFRKARPEGDELRARASAFIAQRGPEVEAAYQGIDLPFLEDRDAEAWESLFALLGVADPARLPDLRECAEFLTGRKAVSERDESLALKLLEDVVRVLGEREAVRSADLVSALKDLDESPWKEIELTQRKLARLLKPFGVLPRQVWVDGENRTGYSREDLEGPAARYLGAKCYER